MAVRIVAISDTHGLHEKVELPEGDILLHTGDLTKWGDLEEVRQFDEFLGTLPHRHKIIIAGNHDFCFERQPKEARALVTNAIYLEDSEVTIAGIKFYGSPWQPWFCNWAFNLPRGKKLKKKWDMIPNDTDVLLTHGPPYGYLDKVYGSGEKVGCEELIKAVERVGPKYHIFGHIHEAYGQDSNGQTAFLNASICTLAYKASNAPMVFQLPGSLV